MTRLNHGMNISDKELLLYIKNEISSVEKNTTSISLHCMMNNSIYTLIQFYILSWFPSGNANVRLFSVNSNEVLCMFRNCALNLSQNEVKIFTGNPKMLSKTVLNFPTKHTSGTHVMGKNVKDLT